MRPLATRAGRSCDADQVVGVVEALVAEREAPQHLRMGNGPEVIAWALRDWCRLAGTATEYIEPGSPWENPFVESFNVRARDELLNIEEFATLLKAQVVVEAWRIEYNTYRPHASLGRLTPAEFRAQWVPVTQNAGTPDPSPGLPAPLPGVVEAGFQPWTTSREVDPLLGSRQSPKEAMPTPPSARPRPATPSKATAGGRSTSRLPPIDRDSQSGPVDCCPAPWREHSRRQASSPALPMRITPGIGTGSGGAASPFGSGLTSARAAV